MLGKISRIIAVGVAIVLACSFTTEGHAEDGIVNPGDNNGILTCPEGYFLIQDICVHLSQIKDIDALVKKILIMKNPQYRELLHQQEESKKKDRQNTRAHSAGNPRVVPLPASGYIYSLDGKYVACMGDYNSWQTASRNVCVGGKFNGCVHSLDGKHVACGGWSHIYKKP